MSDTVKKIQVQLDYHMAEIHRLQSALDVIAEFEGKPAAPEQPMFTIQKITAASKPTKKVLTPPGDGDLSPLGEQIKAVLAHGKPMKVSDIGSKLDYGNRAKKNPANALARLKETGEIVQVRAGVYQLTGKAKPQKKEKLPEGGVSLRKQVLATLEAFPNQALTRGEMLALINMGGRAPSTFDSMTGYLKKTGVITQDENGGWRLVKTEPAEAPAVTSAGESATDVRAA